MPFVYDPRLKGSGYRDTSTGYVLSRAVVREQIDVMISQSQNVQATLSNLVATGTISPADWATAMKQEIKDNYITQYLTGRGGPDSMKPADWGSIGGSLREQYSHLDKMLVQVQAGELSEGQILYRSNMYINSSREAYEKALGRAAGDRGFTEHMWVVDPQAEHCEDCDAIMSAGWLPIDQPFVSPSTGVETVPGSGDTICLTNCKCHVEYR